VLPERRKEHDRRPMAQHEEAERYRQLARNIRELAHKMHRETLKQRTLAIAAELEEMAGQIERGK